MLISFTVLAPIAILVELLFLVKNLLHRLLSHTPQSLGISRVPVHVFLYVGHIFRVWFVPSFVL